MSRRKHGQVRRIHIGDEVWTYIVGDRFVSIRDPERKRTVVPRHNLDDYPTPQVVKDYIWAKLHPVQKLRVPFGTANAKDILFNFFCGARKHVEIYHDKQGRPRLLALKTGRLV